MTSYFQQWLDSVKQPRPVLLVEDSKEDCEMILRMSESFHIQWCVTHTYNGAVDLLRKCCGKFKLIVLDLNLGSNPDGVELFRKIKTDWPDIPVLVFSGHVSNDDITTMTKIGFVMFAQKPQLFDVKFFTQLFLALNIPRKPEAVRENHQQQTEVII